MKSASMKDPFTTSRRFALCPTCDRGFDPVSGYYYQAMPNDCAGVVEPLFCIECRPLATSGTKNVALAVLSAVLFGLGLCVTALFLAANWW